MNTANTYFTNKGVFDVLCEGGVCTGASVLAFLVLE